MAEKINECTIFRVSLRRDVKLRVYHLGMFTNSFPDKIETTGAMPAESQHAI